MKLEKLPRLLEVKRYPDGHPYVLEALDAELNAGREIVDALFQNCSQGPVWEQIFSVFMPQGYFQKDAEAFVKLCKKAWAEARSFAYGVFDEEGKLVGMCEVKEADEEGRAEVGYWLNVGHSGVMTNAVRRLVKETRDAGYRGLFAYTAPENDKSRGVLERSGFKWTRRWTLERRGAVVPVNVFDLDFGD